jgi:hypothetical protein
MTLDDLAAHIDARPPATERTTVTVEEFLPADEGEALSMALTILQEVGDLLDELIERPVKKRKLTLTDMVELQQASDTIYDFLATSAEDWEDTK